VVLYIISQKDVLSPDVLSLRTFCPAGCFVSTDVLSLRTFCLYGHFVPMDVLSHGCYVSGCFVSGCFVSGRFISGRFVWAPKKVPDWVSLVRYWTCSGMVSLFQSGTGLTTCWTVRHSVIYIYMSMDIAMDMQHWHGHATWTWTCSIDTDMQHGHGHDLVMQHGSGQWTCMDAQMLIKSSVRHY
jgi:hypothetical protein